MKSRIDLVLMGSSWIPTLYETGFLCLLKTYFALRFDSTDKTFIVTGLLKVFTQIRGDKLMFLSKKYFIPNGIYQCQSKAS